MPCASKTASTPSVNLRSRSQIRKRMGCGRSLRAPTNSDQPSVADCDVGPRVAGVAHRRLDACRIRNAVERVVDVAHNPRDDTAAVASEWKIAMDGARSNG